ncbi:Protein kinase domain-containing protein [Metarhizium acridum CQMa 102]|uniref:Protein kinase domain-containing protein n=1 Tax=Metarhizium acridum (strain CQMa 102) TaxID=655827 RepID=E9DUP1_METAQ|nr:Protein kinase domain-containing protein [Metarhizium acridum CQMa 102]EFY92703.1 Protein kinase domain-containing protein [Metarhizium acridum CQMa 102]
MAGLGGSKAEPSPTTTGGWDFLKHFGQPTDETGLPTSETDQILNEKMEEEPSKTVKSVTGEDSRRAVIGLPRAQTLKRQLSEQRVNLEPVLPTPDERRAASEDRRRAESYMGQPILPHCDPRSTAPGTFSPSTSSLDGYGSEYTSHTSHLPSDPGHYELSNHIMDQAQLHLESRYDDGVPADAASVAEDSVDEATLAEELSQKWILNLSMHFRDGSKREKFFVTYREKENLWRRVTISLDYRTVPGDSLEWRLSRTREQREKNAKIYEAIRGSIPVIRFFDTVTNLRLQTTDDQLHIHVVEDVNEVIHFPTVDHVKHLELDFFRESDIVFDSHLSGFVYKVHVGGKALIKKDIPSPETIEEFLYEVNALGNLRGCKDIVRLHGLVIDDFSDQIKGLLVTYAEQGSLLDIIYDNCKERGLCIPWPTRQRWARQIVRGLHDIHELGIVQGDFTLNNIVVDAAGDAKIIDINRRGCPAGWEPPELKVLIEGHHRTSLYIGVKSDLFQLGMVLWALAMVDDEPEAHGRPLMLGPEVNIPDWYRQMTEICLDPDPRKRLAPLDLLSMFPPDVEGHKGSTVTADESRSSDRYSVDYSPHTQPYIKTVSPSNGWQCSGKTYVNTSPDMYEPRYPLRGRSPPSSPSSAFDGYDSSGKVCSSTSWAANKSVRPSYSDIDEDSTTEAGKVINVGLRPETPLSLGQYDIDSAAYLPTDIRLEDISPKRATMPAMERKPSLGDGLQTISTPKLARQDTAIHSPTRHDTAETQLSKITPKIEDNHWAESLSEHVDEPAANMTTATEMVDMHTVSDAHEMKTMESDADGGVSLAPGHVPTAHRLLSHSDLHSEAQQDVQQNERPPDVNTRRLVATQIGTDMTESAMTTGREASTDSAVSNKLHTRSVHDRREEARLEDFLLRSSIPDSMSGSHLHQLPISIPAVLTGVGAGLSTKYDTNGLRNMVAVDDDFNALARPATV